MKILQMISSVAIATSIATVAAIVSPVTANAATFTFDNIAGGDTFGDGLNGFLSMDVTDSGNGVLFKFNNAIGNTATNSFIGTVYIDGSTTLLLNSIAVNYANVGVDVDFSGGTGNGNLSQSANLATAFTTDYDFTKKGGASNGVNKGESLGVLFAGANFNNVISAINDGSLRVGYHLQGLPNDKSDSYVNSRTTGTTPTPVPVPGFLVGVMAAGALGGTRLLKNKKQAV